MLTNYHKKLAVLFVGLSTLALGGCATNDEVARAQNTANQASQLAQQANQTAQAAYQNAQAAAAAVARQSSVASRP